MGVPLQLEQLNLAERETQQHKVPWHRRAIGQGSRIACLPVQGLSGVWPCPQGPAARAELVPVMLALLLQCCAGQLQQPPAQAELTARPGQQPAEFDSRLMGQLGKLAAATVGEQVEKRRPGPAAKHQGAHAWRAIGCRCGQLQPAGRRRSPLPLPGASQQLAPRW